MKLSRDPVVWRGAGAGLLNLAVSVGILTRPAADQIDGALASLLVAVVALGPVAAAVLARFRTVPVPAGTPAGTRVLARDSADGVYKPSSDPVGRADAAARRSDPLR